MESGNRNVGTGTTNTVANTVASTGTNTSTNNTASDYTGH